MTTGVTCKISPHCPHPAPADSCICAEHRREARLAELRRSPSLALRAIGHVLTLMADHEAGD